MSTKDILLFETGQGGDFSIVNDDLLLGESFYQQIFLALFGGNIEASTKSQYLDGEERFDYWANALLWKNEQTKQFNSTTERVIQTTTLNSSGRIKIIEAVKVDLEYLKPIADFTVEVEILGRDNLKIIINFTEKLNQQDKSFQMIYSNAKNELIIEKII